MLYGETVREKWRMSIVKLSGAQLMEKGLGGSLGPHHIRLESLLMLDVCLPGSPRYRSHATHSKTYRHEVSMRIPVATLIHKN